MVNFLHTVHCSYQQQQQEQHRKRQQQNQGQGQRPHKRHQHFVRQYNEFLNWQRLRNNTYQNNRGYYPQQYFSPSPQHTPTSRLPSSQRMSTPSTPHRPTRQNVQRGQSTVHPSSNNNSNINNRNNFTRNLRPTNQRIFNTNDNYYSGEQYEYNNEIQEYDHNNEYNDQYSNDLPEENTEDCHGPNEYIHDDSFQQSQSSNNNDIFFNEFFEGKYE